MDHGLITLLTFPPGSLLTAPQPDNACLSKKLIHEEKDKNATECSIYFNQERNQSASNHQVKFWFKKNS